MMKKIVAAILFLALSAGLVPAFAAPAPSPVLFFSDLTSGPNTGGKDNNGVFVTVTGRNLGDSRGSSYVSVGGGKAADYPVWTDNKVSFQLGPEAKTGEITVSGPAGTSNGIRFTVRGGRIFFVDAEARGNGSGSYADPWKSPQDFFKAIQPGDTCYFRKGTYSGRYGSASRSYNVSTYNTGTPSGAPDNEIAWVGYPGETALFKADGNPVSNGAFELMSNVQYHVIAGLSIYGRGDGREQVRLYSDNNKLVNNKIEGIKTLSYAMVGVTAANLKIWGNEMFGAQSANKLDHIIYFQSGGRIENVDIGWNYIHDNDIAVGPVFSWNLGGGTSDNVNIHDNKIDCRNSSDALRLAGIWSGAGGTITFANNLVIGAGAGLNNDDAYNAIYASFGKVSIYNNTFYQSRGAGSNYVVNIYGAASAEVKNNIFYNQDDISYVKGNATLDSNLYFGGSGSVPPNDPRPVTADPRFANPAALDFHIPADSPANGKGADLSRTVPRDFDGIPRITGSIALGAYQHYEGAPLSNLLGNTGVTVTPFGGDGIVSPGQVRVVGSAAGKGAINPAKGETAQIHFQGTGTGRFECRIFTLAGDKVWESSMDNVEGGVFEWAPASLASGVYLVNIKGPGLRVTQKIAILQ
ncbi:MAG: IPT/TIG domain-containing protein [Endomicrobiales bacterium]